jgi:predicted nucleotidyltransferase
MVLKSTSSFLTGREQRPSGTPKPISGMCHAEENGQACEMFVADARRLSGGRNRMMDDLRAKLQGWAATKATIKALYVFGSYARGTAQPDSDLDLAFEFTGVDEPDAELICNARAWKTELTWLTGIMVKDLYHSTDAPVRKGVAVLAFSR